MDAKNTNTLTPKERKSALKQLISLCRELDLFGEDQIGYLLDEIKEFEGITENDILQRVISDGIFATISGNNLLYILSEPDEDHHNADVVKYLIDFCDEITQNDFAESDPTQPLFVCEMLQLWLKAIGLAADSRRTLVSLSAAIIQNAISFGSLADLHFDSFSQLMQPSKIYQDKYETNNFLITLSLAFLLYKQPEIVKKALEKDLNENMNYFDQSAIYTEAFNIMLLIDACIIANS